MAVHLTISDTCVQNIWLSLEHLQPNLPRGGLDPVLGEHAYILFAYAIDRFRGDYTMPECPLRTKMLCKVHLDFGRREFVEGREIKRSSFCLPFARGASSSYIYVATVVIRHAETEKPTSCA